MFFNNRKSECVYKSVCKNWIVTLEILPDTKFANLKVTKFNDNFTEHLINKAKIIKIEHKLTKQQINQIDRFYFQSALGCAYGSININQIVEDVNFNPDKKYDHNHDILGGIKVYKSYEGAYYSEVPTNYTGEWKVFRKSNGILYKQLSLINGEKNGVCTIFQQDGINIETKLNYSNNFQIDSKLLYFSNVLVKFELTDLKLCDKVVIYFNYPSGSISSKCIWEKTRLVEKITYEN